MNAPDKATEIKAAITAVITFFSSLWGGLGWAVIIMISCLFLDYITGSWAARSRGEWSSDIARQGLWHKLGEIVALAAAAFCDTGVKVVLESTAAPILGAIQYDGYITMVVCIWYIFTELGSIIENAGKLGAPIPKWLAKGIAQLKGKVDNAAPNNINQTDDKIE